MGGCVKKFQEVLLAIETIHSFFRGLYTEGLVLGYEAVSVGTLPAMKFRTRYFSRRSGDVSDAIAIPRSMDPSGNLTRRLQQLPGFKFTLENLVEYDRRTLKNDGDSSDINNSYTVIESVSPKYVCRGLLVELDVSFVLVNTRGRKRMIPSFKKLTILGDGCVLMSPKEPRTTTDVDA
ncbi:hypothetical protein Clacol_000915 [Clathrus columnatus]|uniref:Uncharacterized protein n=1 Tax=Clathrus columnatus TaxID=1419009 RepID=A0AAV4ZXD7_9AGAM|nr:hypothetical protein Clacol_000915 [Clathrus columnatus]